MYKILKPTMLLAAITFCLYSFAQVGINEDNTNPDPSAMLDVKSTDKGLLIPSGFLLLYWGLQGG